MSLQNALYQRQIQIVLSGNIKDIKRGYARNIIEIKSENPQNITDALSNDTLAFIKRVTFDRNTIFVTLTDENEKNRLLEALSTLGNQIDEIKVKEPTLNEIFVQFTEGQI